MRRFCETSTRIRRRCLGTFCPEHPLPLRWPWIFAETSS
jgi:hypothetical protein